MEKYDDIKKLAEKATKGNWYSERSSVENDDEFLPDIVICSDEIRNSELDSFEQQCHDANYIAAVQPKVILQLLKEREELIKQLNFCMSINKNQ